MARLMTRRRGWDRFAAWPPGACLLVLVIAVLTLIAASLTARADLMPGGASPSISTQAASVPAASAAPRAQTRDTDLQLYDRIAERVGEGENYYRVAVEEQRLRDFPVRPGLAVRLPTLALITAVLGPAGMMVLAVLLGIGTVAVWWWRLTWEPGTKELNKYVLLLLVIGTVTGLKPQYLVLHEVWAGLLIALAMGLHQRGHWGLAWIAVALALSIRELALPFALLLGALAMWRRDWREAAAWGGLVLVFVLALMLHLNVVSGLTTPADPRSPSWLALRGLGGWTSNIVLSSPLYLLPAWLAAPLALLPVIGWAGWKSDFGLAGFLACLGYGMFFMIAGRDANFYWALLVMPIWFVGLAFLPRSVMGLINSARGY